LEDNIKKNKNGRQDPKKTKNLFLIPLKFRGKPFLGLTQPPKNIGDPTPCNICPDKEGDLA
jgi:hypothetical protein